MTHQGSSKLITLMAFGLVLAMVTFIYSQNEPARPDMPSQAPEARSNNPDRRGGGEFRQRMIERIKQALSVSEEEWTVIQPRLEKVQTLQMQVRGGMMMAWAGRGGRGGGNGAEASSTPVGKAVQELTTLLEDRSVAPEQIEIKLQALRTAREMAKKELATAQAELCELLTQRQEAELVVRGLLD